MSSGSWNPEMTYRIVKDRPKNSPTTLLEDYADSSMTTCWRYYKGKPPATKFDMEIAAAVKLSNTIVSLLSFHLHLHFHSHHHRTWWTRTRASCTKPSGA
jgi:hypothetical protein